MAYTTIDDPTAYFQTKIYTGNGANNRALTFDGNSDLQPDWLWIKNRSETQSHALFDSVRGATKRLGTISASAESTENTNLDSFDSDGFTVDSELIVNGGSDLMVAWAWKAETSVSGNTTGSGTAKAYTGSVNTTSGISIIRYQGNGSAGHTIPHHLGVTPTVMMVKNLTRNAANWSNYQSDFWVSGGNQYIDLNRNAAAAADAAMWNNTQPSSSVFTVGTNERSNYNDHYFINYLFTPIQGYSNFGSYTGNGNANGPFIYTGFQPAWVIVKRSTGTGDWAIMDTGRNPFNVMNQYQKAQAAEADSTDASFDIDSVSNGFKIRYTNSNYNASGGA